LNFVPLTVALRKFPKSLPVWSPPAMVNSYPFVARPVPALQSVSAAGSVFAFGSDSLQPLVGSGAGGWACSQTM
jgi:hypothetical protein